VTEDDMTDLPKSETMLAYASILEKPQYWVDPRGQKWLLATGEIVEAACAALRFCANLWVCEGCGTRHTMEQMLGEHPEAISCCPERKMVSPFNAEDQQP
jgi:hypothetical protein